MPVQGISAYAAYIPSLRLCRKSLAEAHSWSMPALRGLGKGTRSFCSWDEDGITMGVEATRACLNQEPSKNINDLVFASTTAPFADLQNASMVSVAAGLPAELSTRDMSGSTRSGLSALINALQTQSKGDSMVVAADKRRARPGSVQEMHYGAGSAALRISRGKKMIAKYVGSQSCANQFIDHYRTNDGEYDYYWEDRWVRDEGYLKVVPQTVAALLKKTKHTAESITHFCMPGYMPRLSATVAKRMGINADAVIDNLAAEVGDTGAPHALLMLGCALDKAKPGDLILVVGFGAGCDALLLEATDAITDYQQQRGTLDFSSNLPAVTHYNQFLSFDNALDLDWGIRSETDNRVALGQLYRAQDQVTGFNAGVCPSCKAVQFPILASCVKCGSTDEMKRQPLADQAAQVATYTSDRLQYYPAPPMYWGLVQFDNGARLLMEMIEVDPQTFDIGSKLKMVYRIKQKDQQRGLHRYFWKALPKQTPEKQDS